MSRCGKFVLQHIESIEGEGKNAGNKHVFSPNVFEIPFSVGSLESELYSKEVKSTL